MDVIAPDHRVPPLWRDLLGQVQALLDTRGVHPSRAVVLLPYAQLMAQARRCWALLRPDGFAPRFETSMNWAARLGHAPGPEDLTFDMGRDLLTARTWLERAALGSRASLLASRLVESAWQAAGAAAAIAPAQRGDWAARVRPAVSSGLDAPLLALEAAVARIAVEWAAASGYASDTLFGAVGAVDLLVVCEGLQSDPLAGALAALAGDKAVRLALDHPQPPSQPALHEAADPSHEAEIAASCVLRHLEAGRTPVGLPAIDRVLTRRVRGLLEVRGVAVRDETGWKLSTTRAAAHVMGALRACQREPASDAVLDWLKNAPAVAPSTVLALERRVRRQGLRDWAEVHRLGEGGGWAELVARADGWRASMQGSRSLVQWQQALLDLLEATGHDAGLQDDAAGAQLLSVLGLDPLGRAEWSQLPQAARRFSLSEFASWVDDCLEAAGFIPPGPGGEQVVVLPFHQLLARDFGALVLAGCDEVRLPAAPEPAGSWTAAQRLALGLPAREALAAERAAAWRTALQLPAVDLVWRRTDDSGEPVLASPLVQALRLAQPLPLAADPRATRELPLEAVTRPAAQAPLLTVERLSASAYEDLRRCPYRFFALRQLGLQEAAELDVEVDKRDFGNWLHLVLRRFHEALLQAPDAPRAGLLDQCAHDATRSLGLAGGEFLPFAAAWPQVREGYLDWLAGHEAQGARFAGAETEHEVALGRLRLVGRIDRIDVLPDGRRMVIDYKTEAATATADRVRVPQEDTQLAFYAALLEDDTLRAAYVNVGERGLTKTVEQPEVVDARDALVAGIVDDIARIEAGAPLPALGEGRTCGFCAARGLCRRDFWHD